MVVVSLAITDFETVPVTDADVDATTVLVDEVTDDAEYVEPIVPEDVTVNEAAVLTDPDSEPERDGVAVCDGEMVNVATRDAVSSPVPEAVTNTEDVAEVQTDTVRDGTPTEVVGL